MVVEKSRSSHKGNFDFEKILVLQNKVLNFADAITLELIQVCVLVKNY